MAAYLGFILAFIAGFVDTATFVGARGVFSAHVTGNFVLFAVAMMKGAREIDYLKLFLFVPFVLSVAFVSKVSRVKSLAAQYERGLLIVASLLLAVPAVYFFGVTKLEDELWDVANIFIMLPVLAMGIQNALYKIVTPTDPMTTVMTGNVTGMVLEFLSHGKSQKARAFMKILLGFFLGCLCAAWLVTIHSLGVLLIPSIMLMGIALHKTNLREQRA